MTPETTRRKRAPIEVELWTSAPARRWEGVGPLEVRVRAGGELTFELEARLDRRLARAAHAAGAEAVLEVRRTGPVGTGSARVFEGRGLGVRWTEPPTSSSRPGTAAATANLAQFTTPSSSLSVLTSIVGEASPALREVATAVVDSPLAQAAARRLATIAQGSPARRRAAAALTDAFEARAGKLAVSPEARARLERWTHEAREEVGHRPKPTETQAMKLPGGCALIIFAILALFAFNVFGTCIRTFSTFTQ